MYNVEDYIGESIDSVINQTFDFNKVQVILVDDGSTDSTKDIALEYQSKYPDNILVLSKENGGASSARNLGLKYVEGEYVYFFDSDDKLSENALTAVYNIFEKYEDIDIVTLPIVHFERIETEHGLNFKFKQHHQVIDIFEHPDHIVLHGPATVLRFSAIGDHRFSEDIINSVDALFLNEILISKGKYATVGWEDNAIFYYRKRFANNSIIDKSASNPRYFTDKLINYFLALIKLSIKEYGYVIGYVQNFVVYDLQGLVKVPELPDSFDNDEIKEFWNYFKEILSYVDDDVIINSRFLIKNVKNFFIYFKRKDFHTVLRKNKVFLKSGDYVINKLHNHRLYFDSIQLEDNLLNFSGSYSSSCDSKFINIIAELKFKDGRCEIFNASKDKSKSPSIKRFLSIDWKFFYNFNLKIPLKTNEVASIKFKLIYNENDNEVVMSPNITFRDNCSINESNNFFSKDSRIIIFENNMFYLAPYSYLKLAKLSLKSIIN